MRDMEVLAGSQFNIMENRLERHFVRLVAFCFNLDNNGICSHNGLCGRRHGNPETMRFILREDETCLVEQWIRKDV